MTRAALTARVRGLDEVFPWFEPLFNGGFKTGMTAGCIGDVCMHCGPTRVHIFSATVNRSLRYLGRTAQVVFQMALATSVFSTRRSGRSLDGYGMWRDLIGPWLQRQGNSNVRCDERVTRPYKRGRKS